MTGIAMTEGCSTIAGRAAAPRPRRARLSAAAALALCASATVTPVRGQTADRIVIIQETRGGQVQQVQVGGTASPQSINEVTNLTGEPVDVRQAVHDEVLQLSVKGHSARQSVNRVVAPFGRHGAPQP